jgi:hypothetical protein
MDLPPTPSPVCLCLLICWNQSIYNKYVIKTGLDLIWQLESFGMVHNYILIWGMGAICRPGEPFLGKNLLSIYRIQHPATFYICHETIIREARVIKHIMETNATNKTNVRPKTAATHLSN